jgi:hypothetical protein
METQTVSPTAPQSEARSVPRQPYTPPAASFVPLRMEERLGACNKTPGDSTFCDLKPSLS